MSEREMGALTGAAQGAMTGAAFGPVGAFAGAVIGGIGGLVGGGQAKKARKYANRAKALQRKMSLMDAGLQRRDMIRGARISRAESVAASASTGEGGLQSSAPLGAVSSLSAQLSSNVRYFDQRIRDMTMVQYFIDKAGQKANQAGNTAAFMGLLNTAAGMAGSLKPYNYGAWHKGSYDINTANYPIKPIETDFGKIPMPSYNLGP